MDVDERLKTALDALGAGVARVKYTGRANRFLTYQLVHGGGTHFSDDEAGATEYSYHVHVYSKTDYASFLRKLRAALTAAGFYGWSMDAETYEQDTGYYHITVAISYLEE